MKIHYLMIMHKIKNIQQNNRVNKGFLKYYNSILIFVEYANIIFVWILIIVLFLIYLHYLFKYLYSYIIIHDSFLLYINLMNKII